ncbi:MAG: hypothetical protein ACP5HZ_07565 [Ferrimicrobium sp.]
MDVSIVPVRSAELGNTSYLLVAEQEKVVVVIDPVRDIGQYLDIVASAELELTWSLETHVHNDFVSGSREFASTVGSKIGASSDAGLRYHYEHLSDGDEIGLGSWRLRVLATPGHTLEHVAYLLLNAMGQPEAFSPAEHSWLERQHELISLVLRSHGDLPTTWSVPSRRKYFNCLMRWWSTLPTVVVRSVQWAPATRP